MNEQEQELRIYSRLSGRRDGGSEHNVGKSKGRTLKLMKAHTLLVLTTHCLENLREWV